MNNRKVTQLVRAVEITEGAGVKVHRSIGIPARRSLDPFLMLDHIGSDNPDEYSAGFPEHPHRGFNTFTYMVDGHMQHRDSMGNRGELGPGGAQWMKAASGVVHSEMPLQIDGLMRGFQLWINLPANQKMSAPAYQEIRPESVPEISNGKARVRVLAGKYAEHTGPVTDPNTEVEFLDVGLQRDSIFVHVLSPRHSAFVYAFEGGVFIEGTDVSEHQLAILGNGQQVRITAPDRDARLLLVAGKPIGEPIVQYGPFVMNTKDEINRAMADYQAGNLVQKKAAMKQI